MAVNSSSGHQLLQGVYKENYEAVCKAANDYFTKKEEYCDVHFKALKAKERPAGGWVGYSRKTHEFVFSDKPRDYEWRQVERYRKDYFVHVQLPRFANALFPDEDNQKAVIEYLKEEVFQEAEGKRNKMSVAEERMQALLQKFLEHPNHP